LAALISALRVVNKKIEDISITFIGARAANMNCAKYIMLAGANPEKMIMVDSKEILHKGRIELMQDTTKWNICKKTNKEGRTGNIKNALKKADVLLLYINLDLV